MRSPLLVVGITLLAIPFSQSFAGPAELLEKAVQEDNKVPGDGQSVQQLLSEGDRLAAQKNFNDAVRLFERAYRMAPANRDAYVRLLVAKRAAGTMTQQDREALKLVQDQETAEVDSAFREARLNILKAKQALHDGDLELARTITDGGLANLDRLPSTVDTSVYYRQLKTIQTAAYKKSAKAHRASPKNAPAVNAQKTRPTSVARKVAPVDTEDFGPTLSDEPDEKPIKHSTSRVQQDPHDAFEETGEIIPTPEEDFEHRAYDRAVAASLARNRVDWLLSTNEAAIAPTTDMTYPADWQDKSARRTRYRDGVIYETEPFTGQDGKTYTTAIYDLGDLVHPVPNFYADYPGTARRQRIEDMDRFYLQERSQIFNGYPEDLAAGLPLLHFFGGIDNNAVSSRTDPRETERVMQILQRFLQSQ